LRIFQKTEHPNPILDKLPRNIHFIYADGTFVNKDMGAEICERISKNSENSKINCSISTIEKSDHFFPITKAEIASQYINKVLSEIN